MSIYICVYVYIFVCIYIYVCVYLYMYIGRGIISNDQVGGFKFIIIYNKFHLFIRISGEYVSMNQCFPFL